MQPISNKSSFLIDLSTLDSIAKAYHNSGKDFAIMKSLRINTFEKIQFPYSVNRLETDNRPVEFITPDDFHLVKDDYSIYKGSTDKKVDVIYSGINESDYEIINELLKTLELFEEGLEPEDNLIEEYLSFYKRCELEESTERLRKS